MCDSEGKGGHGEEEKEGLFLTLLRVLTDSKELEIKGMFVFIRTTLRAAALFHSLSLFVATFFTLC